MKKRAHIIVLGNEKGGSGKSTTAMHLIVALLQRGRSVACMDLDVRQGTLSHYLENRRIYAEANELVLPMPEHRTVERCTFENRRAARVEEQEQFEKILTELIPNNDIVLIDTAGTDSFLNRLAHAYADTLVTPLNDSFVDLDVLARIEGDTMKVQGPSHYAEMIWEQRMQRTTKGGSKMDWVVMRNRLSSLDAKNKRAMARVLKGLSTHLGFRLIAGFGERVVFRELFLKGLTMMDLPYLKGKTKMNMSHVAARQEVRALLEAMRLG